MIYSELYLLGIVFSMMEIFKLIATWKRFANIQFSFFFWKTNLHKWNANWMKNFSVLKCEGEIFVRLWGRIEEQKKNLNFHWFLWIFFKQCGNQTIMTITFGHSFLFIQVTNNSNLRFACKCILSESKMHLEKALFSHNPDHYNSWISNK